MHGLSMIYRAITSIPDPRVLPNIEFTIDRMDLPNPPGGRPDRTVWAWTRRWDDNDTWVMPDFNGWATGDWEAVGGYRAFREKVMLSITPFKKKIRKAIWRGQINVGRKAAVLFARESGRNGADPKHRWNKTLLLAAQHNKVFGIEPSILRLAWIGLSSRCAALLLGIPEMSKVVINDSFNPLIAGDPWIPTNGM